MRKRHVPVKALILDQAVISGVGNWVADESLYQAKLHPEQYCDGFSDQEIHRLHEAIVYVCQTAIDLLGDSDRFPDHWLFNYRWGKGRKEASALPNGEKLAFIKVGGRTSCYAPAVQKKTGHVAPGIKEELLDDDGTPEKPKRATTRKSPTEDTEEDEVKPRKQRQENAKKQEPKEDKKDEKENTRPRKKAKVREAAAKVKPRIPKTGSSNETSNAKAATGSGRRRSARLGRT